MKTKKLSIKYYNKLHKKSFPFRSQARAEALLFVFLFSMLQMYGCESWTRKKAKHQRTDSFELWCWRRLLRVPWTARRSNQSILKEISPGYSLEGLMLKLKLQYFGHLMWSTNSLEKTLMLWKVEGRRRGRQRMRWDGWMSSPIQWAWVWANSGRHWRTGQPGVWQFRGLQRVGHDWATTGRQELLARKRAVTYPQAHHVGLGQQPGPCQLLLLAASLTPGPDA